MDQIVFPTSLGEVEALVVELYQPGPPQKIAKIQETLQTLQRSPEGWQLADSLLANADEKIRFFGALTFIVKINTDSQNLSEADARSLLQTLLGWLNRSLEFPEGPLVVKKLCSVLVAYFIQFSASWTRCVRHVLYCLCLNQVVPYEEIDKAPETGLLVQNLPKPRALAILWFSTALVEEVGKTDSNSMKHHQFHQRLLPNVSDIVVLVKTSIGDSPQAMSVDVKIRQESMACYQAWVLYSHRAFVDAAIVLEPLKTLAKPAIMCLLQDDLYEISIELFSDVLANYSRFLGEEEFGLLHSLFNSSWTQERYERLVTGDFDFDSQQFGMFMIAFGDATVQDLVQKAHSDVKCGQFLAALAGLLGAEGFAVHEDKIFVPALEFWATFVETMIDESYSRDGGEPPWLQAALAHLMKAVENCWRKIQFPPNEVFSSWDSADRTAFNDARKDVSDLLEQAYTQTGPALFSMFVDMILRSIQSEVWAELEASLYCLKAFPDCVSSDEVICDDLLDKVFGSSIFSMFADPEKGMPPRARQTFLDLIASYSDYFERHSKYLPNALDTLFKAIESLPGLSEKASKSVLSLCSSCRGLLVPEVGIFLQEYSKFAHVPSLDSLVKERTLGAIASIIQAIPESTAKLGPLDQLLCFVEADIEQSLVLLGSKPAADPPLSTTPTPQLYGGASNFEAAQGLALMSLRCLGSIARGLQVPSDVPVDIDGNGVTSTFWATDKGAIIQQRIVTMIVTTQDAFAHQGDIVEAACFIFRAGFTEHESGPFVLPLLTVARVLQKFTLQTSRLGIAISTACSLVSSQSAGTNHRIDDILRELLVWVSQLLHALGEPHNDPEIAQYGIEFMQRLVEKDYLDVLLNHQPPSSLEYLFMFTLKALTGKEFLPKFASAEFWSSLVPVTVETPETRASIDIALKHFGPLLAQALVYNIGGNAARSELDRLAEPLKKLVVRGVQSKSWLETALFGDDFRNTKVSAADKKLFLQKIINLRGARGTNQVVRDFWLACRGSNFAYAS